MRSRILTLLALLLVIFPAGCEDTVTEPEEEPETVYGGLVIQYEAEAGSAESVEITPESGGTVTASGTDGVTYELDVAPGAVQGAVTVTVTPLRDLSIVALDSSRVDTSDCIAGALFEPDGLEFDSDAVLTITYPASGLNCTLSEYF